MLQDFATHDLHDRKVMATIFVKLKRILFPGSYDSRVEVDSIYCIYIFTMKNQIISVLRHFYVQCIVIYQKVSIDSTLKIVSNTQFMCMFRISFTSTTVRKVLGKQLLIKSYSFRS